MGDLMPQFKQTSSLTRGEIDWCRTYLHGKPPFSLYFEGALDALKHGLDNRSIYFGKSRNGLILKIQFDDISVSTTLGKLQPEELKLTLSGSSKAELHVPPEHAKVLMPHCSGRLQGVQRLRYYHMEVCQAGQAESRCRTLGRQDFRMLQAFFHAHYPETVFSSWMLDSPFVGLFENGELMATGGTIIWSKPQRSANIGNFLTATHARGRGLAKIVARHLMYLLHREGISHFTLGTTEENRAAWRTYEAIGFTLRESRVQIDLSEDGNSQATPTLHG